MGDLENRISIVGHIYKKFNLPVIIYGLHFRKEIYWALPYMIFAFKILR